MTQNRTGWWTIGGFAGLTLLGLYVAAYYAAVQPSLSRASTSLTLKYEPHYGRLGNAGVSIFRPMHLVDRGLRPAYWSEAIEQIPGVSKQAGESAPE